MRIPKNFHNVFLEEDIVFEKGEPHAVRASDLLRLGGRSPHFGGADARQELQPELSSGEGNRSACVRLLPCLSAGGRRLLDATALSGDGFQDTDPPPFRRKERGRRNAVMFPSLPATNAKRLRKGAKLRSQ